MRTITVAPACAECVAAATYRRDDETDDEWERLLGVLHRRHEGETNLRVRPYAFSAIETLSRQSGSDLASALGVTTRQVIRWRETGLTEGQADRVAVACGFHPSEVWPEWFSTK